MLGIILKILSILGIILLALLALALFVLLLVLFFPITYRIRGCKDEDGPRLSVKVNWLFWLFRVRYRYPEPGHLTAKALWFSLFDMKIPPDKSPKKEQDGKKSGRNANSEKDKKTDNATVDSAGGKAGQKSTESVGKAVGNDNGQANVIQKNDETAAEGISNRKARGTVTEIGTVQKAHKVGSADSSQQNNGTTAIGNNTVENDVDESDDDAKENETPTEEAPAGLFGKISQKFKKIKYTICNTYDKIKKIWKNISYYIELLQEENTKQLASHAIKRALIILKSIRPRRIKAELLFGMDSPDTTGYLYGIYCMVSALYGGTFVVTPDFERKIFEGEFDIAGHVMVWVFAVNGVKLLLDKRLRWLLKKLKAGQGKSRKAAA